MMKNELIIKEQNKDNRSIVRRILSSTWNSFVWGFLSALMIGCLAAGIWTILPTAWLPWGASKMNLIGYISHCSYAPISTSILLVSSLIGFFLFYKKGGKNPVGYSVLGITVVGLVAGLIGGFGIATFIGMGIAVGVAIVLGIFIGLRYPDDR